MANAPLTAAGQPKGQKSAPYPRLVAFASALRRQGLFLLLTFLGATVGAYLLSPKLFALLQGHLHQKLVFYTVAEPFVAHVKLAVGAALLATLPLLASGLWRALAVPFKLSRASQVLFTICTCLLFYGGALFCYLLPLSYGIDFLLSFGSAELRPLISIDQFVTFVGVFVLSFGLIFELPVFMVFTAKVGLLPRALFERSRRYAILLISIVAALLTPTPDIFNMMLMGLPLYGLYEVGIVILRIMDVR